MKNYKITLQYDGTKYDGWQKQGNTKNTIQGKLEDILAKLSGRETEVAGSGRTDAGAHAFCQVANFKIETQKSPREIMEHLNKYLPMDIGVTSCEVVDPRFHSRLNAKSKIYKYRIWNSTKHNVFEKNQVFFSPEKLNVTDMKNALVLFLGEHDFKGFCSNKKYKKPTLRTIYKAEINVVGDEVHIEFEGNGFLYNMVRIMVGTLIEIGEGKRKKDNITEVFKTGDRQKAGFLAPAEGLMLMEVKY